MNITNLSNEELRVFFEDGFSLQDLRNIFIYNNKFTQKLRGFRAKTANKAILVTTSINLVKHEKNGFFISFISDFYNNHKNMMSAEIEKLIESGYSKEFAMAEVIHNRLSEKFRPIYFKLEEFSEEEIERIKNDYLALRSIRSIVSLDIKTALSESIKELKDNTNKRIEQLEKQIVSLKKEIDLMSNNFDKKNLNAEDLNSQIETLCSLLSQEKSFNSQEFIRLDKAISMADEKVKELNQNNDVLEIKKQIELLKNEINEKTFGQKNNFTIVSVLNNEFETFDEYLYDNIGDVIENIVEGEQFDVLRECLVELIYSKKPILADANNSEKIALILSSIVTGGNYTIINLDENYQESSLIEALETIKPVSGNKVIIIKNKINVSDYRGILNYIKTRPFNEKYIFEFGYAKEARFFAPEILNEFNFFFGQFQSNSVVYKYSYDFKNTSRKLLKNAKFDSSLKEVGISLSSNEIMNVKFYGIFVLSILPFVKYNSGEDYEDIINKLSDQELRRKCEAMFND